MELLMDRTTIKAKCIKLVDEGRNFPNSRPRLISSIFRSHLCLRIYFFSSSSSHFLRSDSDLSAMGAFDVRRSIQKQNDNIEKTITYCERPQRIRDESSRQLQIQILGEVKR